jgi:hypothetical protein
MNRTLLILALLSTWIPAGCSPSSAEVAQEALTALERDGAEGLLPYLTRDGRRFVASMDLSGFSPEDSGVEIVCVEEETDQADAGWRWVVCVQGDRRLRVAVVDTGRGRRLDPFRWSFEPLTEGPAGATTGGLP